MQDLSLCRICLATDVRLCSIASHLQDMYERITAMTFKREETRPLVVCYICHARLQNCYRLRRSCLQSEKLFTEVMSSNVLKQQDVLSTNTFRVVSAFHFSLGHKMLCSTESCIKEEAQNIIYDAGFDQHNTEDIVMAARKQCSVIDDNNQCLYLEDPLIIIKREPDDVETDDKDMQLDIEDTALEENDLNSVGPTSQLADNACPKIVKVVLQRIDINDTGRGDRVLKKLQVAALKETEDASTNERRESLTTEDPTIVTKKNKFLKTCDKLDIRLSKCENVVKSLENDDCEDKTQSNTSLELNASSIKGSRSKPYSCDICKQCFRFQHVLKVHTLTHTGEKLYPCNVCKICFNSRSTLKTHFRTHTDEKPFQCDICYKCFIDKGNLKHHIRTHVDEKPYRCNICNRCFTLKRSLQRHVRIHTGEKPYECNVCEKCYIRKEELNIHILTHTGEKPFQCNVCKRRFIRSRNLRRGRTSNKNVNFTHTNAL